MRKRIVIGVLAVIGVGSLLYLVSGPKHGSVEYHLTEFNRAQREWRGETWRDRCAEAWCELMGKPYQPYINMSDSNNPQARSERHEQALIDLGYWEFREFRLTNSAKVWKRLQSFGATLPPDAEWEIGFLEETNKIIIRSRRVYMPKWEDAVRKADVP